MSGSVPGQTRGAFRCGVQAPPELADDVAGVADFRKGNRRGSLLEHPADRSVGLDGDAHGSDGAAGLDLIGVDEQSCGVWAGSCARRETERGDGDYAGRQLAQGLRSDRAHWLGHPQRTKDQEIRRDGERDFRGVKLPAFARIVAKGELLFIQVAHDHIHLLKGVQEMWQGGGGG